VSILQVDRPETTPSAPSKPRRRGRGPWVGLLIVVLLGGLVAGIVVNKVSDDRNQAKRADQRPTDVTCVDVSNAIGDVVQATSAYNASRTLPAAPSTTTSKATAATKAAPSTKATPGVHAQTDRDTASDALAKVQSELKNAAGKGTTFDRARVTEIQGDVTAMQRQVSVGQDITMTALNNHGLTVIKGCS
jgi:hypothetical protein